MRQEGFTMVELMISIVVITVALFSLGYLMKESGVVNRRVKEKDIAYEAISNQLEMLRSTSYADFDSGTYAFSVPELADSTGRIEIINMGSPNLSKFRKITISLQWRKWGSDAIMGDTITTYATERGLGQ